MVNIYAPMNVSDMTDISGVFGNYLTSVTGGIFWAAMLGVVWFIIFIGTLSEGRQASRGFILASFICSILSVPLVIGSWLNNQFMYLFFLLTAIGLVWFKLDNSPGI